MRIIVITGPTATGKTRLGVLLSKRFNGEVISADSMQIYKGMDIGTAAPSPGETENIPHHLVRIVPPSENYSAARYVEDAEAVIEDISRRGKQPFLVGGTGLYIDSLLSGRSFLPRDAGLREELSIEYDRLGAEHMFERLRLFDPESAKILHRNDKKRIVRALETYLVTGKPISEHNKETGSLPPRYEYLKIALNYKDRAVLYAKINARVDAMFENGLVNEVEALLLGGADKNSTAMQAIGYKETAMALSREIGMEEAAELIKRESRRYAKRQITWLNRQKDVRWIFLEDAQPPEDVFARAEAMVLGTVCE